MADTKDFATTIASALAEVGVTGKVEVKRDDEQAAAVIGQPGGDDVDVEVVVKPLP